LRRRARSGWRILSRTISRTIPRRKWDQALSSDRLLTEASRRKTFTPGRGGFGFGWLIKDVWGRKSIGHGGGAPGYSAWIERWPGDGTFVAVLSNVTNARAGEIGRSLAAILFGQDYELPAARTAIDVNPGLLDEYAGRYQVGNGDVRTVIRQGNSLVVRRNDGPAYPILPFARDRFYFPYDKGASLRFPRNGAGAVEAMVLHQLGVDEKAVKIADGAAPPRF
jgi:hypothetical protein